VSRRFFSRLLVVLALLGAGSGAAYFIYNWMGQGKQARAERPASTIPGWPARVTTVAGDGVPGAADGAVGHARFGDPFGLALDRAGNLYVADAGDNNRIRKIGPDGLVTTLAGAREGFADGLGTKAAFNTPSGLAVDAAGNVYVADTGNKRIQVFDGDGNFKSQISNIGSPAAICITPGARPFLYSSNSNPPENIDADGEIYKVELSGKIVGKFGRAGKLPKEFGTVNAISCRGDNELYVGEIGNWRVQKLTLRPN